MNVTGLDEDYAALLEGVVRRIRTVGLQVRAILADREFFNRSAISKFYLVAIPNPEFDPWKRAGPGNKDFLLFATSIAFGSTEEFVKRVPRSYRARWNIETGYRVKKEFILCENSVL